VTNHGEEWLTIREASIAMGVSELTIRRRIKDGRMVHRMVGGKYYVNPRIQPPVRESGAARLRGPALHPGRAAERVPSPPNGPAQRRAPARQSDHDAGEEIAPRASQAQPPTQALGEGIALESILAEYARVAERAGRASLLEQRVAELASDCEDLRGHVLALTGRNGWLESKLEERESEVRLLTQRDSRPGFWRRLFRIPGPEQER
jgi:excisionase family DNA binding protein